MGEGKCYVQPHQRTEFEYKTVWRVWAYTSQGERPSIDLVRQVLISCGMSWTVHKIAPVANDDDKIMDIPSGMEQVPDPWFRKCSRPMHSRAFTVITL
jgi:hypothetical protein